VLACLLACLFAHRLSGRSSAHRRLPSAVLKPAPCGMIPTISREPLRESPELYQTSRFLFQANESFPGIVEKSEAHGDQISAAMFEPKLEINYIYANARV